MRSMHFNKHFNKKASLEISIQAIVIVVLAMTILGLGLGFTKGIFKKIFITTEDVSDQVRQKIVEDLVQGDKRVSFPKTEVAIDRGSSTVLTVGIRNQHDTKLAYKMSFTLVSPTSTEIASTTVEPFKSWTTAQKGLVTGMADASFIYSKDTRYTLGATESDVRNIRLETTSDMPSSSYFFVFSVLEPDISKTPTITAGTETACNGQKGFWADANFFSAGNPSVGTCYYTKVYAEKDFFVVVR